MEKLERYIKKTPLKQCNNIDPDKLKSVLECDDITLSQMIELLRAERVLTLKYSFDCPICKERNTFVESQISNTKCQHCFSEIDIEKCITGASVRYMINVDDFNEYYSEFMRNNLLSLHQLNGSKKIVKIDNQKEENKMSNKVFIVHGHDDAAKESVARVLEKLGFEAIILHEQPNAGRTIIEKIESYTDVAYGVVLYTECDLGRDKKSEVDEEKYRARQNVVFEHGYLISKLGRNNVCAIVKGDVERPGDIDGVVYISMDENGAWKIDLCKDMKEAGLNVDANKII